MWYEMMCPSMWSLIAFYHLFCSLSLLHHAFACPSDLFCFQWFHCCCASSKKILAKILTMTWWRMIVFCFYLIIPIKLKWKKIWKNKTESMEFQERINQYNTTYSVDADVAVSFYKLDNLCFYSWSPTACTVSGLLTLYLNLGWISKASCTIQPRPKIFNCE